MPDVTEQRKLAAIMFTDMVGYSALSQRDDKLALELLEEHRQLLREIFPRFNGTEIKTIGDAFLVEFTSALEAAQCAIEIQRALAKRNCDVANERRIELKIGIHIGDVVHRGGDVYGDGVNIASRIEPLAGAGGICVSMDVERQIRNALEARFEKLAPTELKNISVAMDLFRIVLPWEQRASGVAKSGATSVARPTVCRDSGRSPVVGDWHRLVVDDPTAQNSGCCAAEWIAYYLAGCSSFQKLLGRYQPGIFRRWNNRPLNNRTELDWRGHSQIAPVGSEIQELNKVDTGDRRGVARRRNRRRLSHSRWKSGHGQRAIDRSPNRPPPLGEKV